MAAIPAQFVKQFVRGNKNDHNDAQAIAEASQRPNIKMVPIKTINQQDLQSLIRIRELRVRQRTSYCNQLRGFLVEYRVIMAKSKSALIKNIPMLLCDEEERLTTVSKAFVSDIYQDLLSINSRIDLIEKQIKQLAAQNEDYSRLNCIPGVGPILSAALIAMIGNGHQFSNGRELACWVGLTPKQKASGNKSTMLGLSKRGNRMLRTLFIHGARAAFSRTKNRDCHLLKWADKIAEKRGQPKAWIALANKLARVTWAIVNKKVDYVAEPCR